jgi:hypothetical protein
MVHFLYISVALLYFLLYISPTVYWLPPLKQELTDRILASLFQEQEIGSLGLFVFFLKRNTFMLPFKELQMPSISLPNE